MYCAVFPLTLRRLSAGRGVTCKGKGGVVENFHCKARGVPSEIDATGGYISVRECVTRYGRYSIKERAV